MTESRRRLSTTYRWFDLRLPSNRFVLGASGLAAIGFTVFRIGQGDTSGAAVSRGLEAGFSVLLSWALARELDPDRPASASAAGVVGFLILLTGPTNLGAVTALLFAIRLVTRTPGAPPTNLDVVWLPGLAAYSARSTGGFLAGLALALALAWDAERPHRGLQTLSALAAAAFAIGLAAFRGTLAPHAVFPTPWQWVVLGAAPLSVVWLRGPAAVSVGDLSGERLDHRRLVRARLLAVATGILVVVWLGGAAAPAFVGLWAAFVGIAVVRMSLRQRIESLPQGPSPVSAGQVGTEDQEEREQGDDDPDPRVTEVDLAGEPRNLKSHRRQREDQ
jgi:hypothetical protein